ncbi:MAG TPA: hypothetical protein VKG80_17735 [Trebonia sp.]|nr:hypothetical protein [Trebonia sp.]
MSPGRGDGANVALKDAAALANCGPPPRDAAPSPRPRPPTRPRCSTTASAPSPAPCTARSPPRVADPRTLSRPLAPTAWIE